MLSASTNIYCRECNYPLHELPEPRCPECGTTFDLNAPSTVHIGRPRWVGWRWWLRPPGKWFHALVGFTGFLSLIASAAPVAYLLPVLAAMLLWMLLGIFWLLRATVYLVGSLRFRRPLIGPHAKRWLYAPLFVGAIFVLLAGRVPFRLAFALSQPALERAANDPNISRGWIGAFPVNRITREPEMVHFSIWHSGFLDTGCIAYELQPNFGGARHYKHRPHWKIRDKWWMCLSEF